VRELRGTEGVLRASLSERDALAAQLGHQAFHDSPTDLANRALFNDRVRHALARSRRDGSGLAVLLQACRQMAGWNADAGPLLLHVNLSAHHLLRNDLAANVAAALGDSGLPPECLALEITESVDARPGGGDRPPPGAEGARRAPGHRLSRPVPAADMARLAVQRPVAGLRHPA
jgi:predicted signal transduction protein with EAL and GGDEF domain